MDVYYIYISGAQLEDRRAGAVVGCCLASVFICIHIYMYTYIYVYVYVYVYYMCIYIHT